MSSQPEFVYGDLSPNSPPLLTVERVTGRVRLRCLDVRAPTPMDLELTKQEAIRTAGALLRAANGISDATVIHQSFPNRRTP